MDYLKIFNLTNEDIDEIIDFIDTDDYNELFINREKVTNILNYFLSIGIINIKDILMYKTDIFYDELDYIKSKLNNNLNLINLINEDVLNIDLIRNN